MAVNVERLITVNCLERHGQPQGKRVRVSRCKNPQSKNIYGCNNNMRAGIFIELMSKIWNLTV
jgi:hypothetical protein